MSKKNVRLRRQGILVGLVIFRLLMATSIWADPKKIVSAIDEAK
jgi:hypothetical protein